MFLTAVRLTEGCTVESSPEVAAVCPRPVPHPDHNDGAEVDTEMY